jgi:hypothetical protein
MAAADVWADAQKFAYELTKRVPTLKKLKAKVDKDLSNAEQAMDRYSSYKPNHDDGTYRCPQCWVCLGEDRHVGPTGKRDERLKEIWKCVWCDYSFVVG